MSRALPSRLYAIADPGPAGGDVVELAARILAGGARILQLRWKQASTGDLFAAARECRALARRHGALFFVNDRADVALACDADGVHLGQTDLPLRAARRVLGAERWIGVSTHDPDQARAAEAGGADYVGFGAIFETRTKAGATAPQGLARLREVRATVALPIVAVGGIDAARAREVIAAGADAVAMISALASAKDVTGYVRDLVGSLDGPKSA
jgi:thiamine-phosphate pyrophosphorylase